ADAKLKELQKIYQKAQEELTEAEADEDYLDVQSRITEWKTKIQTLESSVETWKTEKREIEIGIPGISEQEKQSELDAAVSNLDKLVKEMAGELIRHEDNYKILSDISDGREEIMQAYYDDATGLLSEKLVEREYAENKEQADAFADEIKTSYKALTEYYAEKKTSEETIQRLQEELKEIQSFQADKVSVQQLQEKIEKAEYDTIPNYRWQLQKAENDVSNYESIIQRLKSLVEDAKDQMDAQQDVVDSLSNASNAAATVKNCKEQLEDLIFQQGLGDGSYLDLQAAKEEIEKQKEKIEKLMENADEQEVTAKVGGVISAISVTAGNTVGAEMPMATINLVDRGYTIKIPVTTEQSKKVKIGDKAELLNYWGGDVEAVLEAFANDPSNPGKGKLLVFRLTGDVEPNQNYTLSIGQKSAKFDCLVPNAAIRNDSNGSFVLALVAKSTPLSTRYIATRVDVQIQANDDTYSAVTGLTGGDFVITTSTKPIEPGTQVRLVDNG
ncbi:MAG: HlyD family efflux transporter periplasmic adaptor subunit, partial [Clostridia bacterium]|nr:HlyD family efflux transporter periplasmic adaptor subunit [Clostridia bacterium]